MDTRFTVLALVGLLLACGTSARAQVDTVTQQALVTKNIGIDQNLGEPLPMDTEWFDDTGKKVTLGELFQDRPVVIIPAFYRCKGSCPLIFEGALKAFNGLSVDSIGETYDVITYSINSRESWEEAKEKKAGMLEIYDREGAAENWHFLVGSKESIDKLSSALGFRFQAKPDSDLINHPAGIMVITPEGRISRYLYGVEYPPKLLLQGVLAAKNEDISAKAEPILFGCFSYNPVTGGLKANVNRIMILMGVATVLTLAVSIVVMTIKTNRQEARLKNMLGGQGPSTP